MTVHPSTRVSFRTMLSPVRQRASFRNVGHPVRVIRTLDDIAWLRANQAFRRRIFVILELPNIPEATSSAFESKLNSALHSCGCSAGAAACVAAFSASILWQSAVHGWSFSSLPGFLVRTLLVVFFAAGIGKFAGLAFAKYRLKRITTLLTQYVANSTSGGSIVDLHKVGG
jgi:hypothetical protein